jgi:hypothetical protein
VWSDGDPHWRRFGRSSLQRAARRVADRIADGVGPGGSLARDADGVGVA